MFLIPIELIDDNPYQSRSEYGDIAELAQNIATARAHYPASYGLMQIPRGRVIFSTSAETRILTRADIDGFISIDGRHLVPDSALRVQLAYGHRRARAIKILSETSAPGYDGYMPIHLDELTDQQMLDAVWSENYDRRDITAVEQAQLLSLKLEQLGNQSAVAEQWNIARSTVANKLRLLQLPADIQQANRDGRLSERACIDLLPIVELAHALNGRSLDDLKRATYFRTPPKPGEILRKAISGDGLKSEDLRDYLHNVSICIGQPIPRPIADMESAHPLAVQTTCKNCPARWRDNCLNDKCLTAKKHDLQTQTLNAVAAELGYKIASPADIPADWTTIHQIESAHKSGVPATYLIYWHINSGQCYRPFTLDPHAHIQDKEALANPRHAIAITVTGGQPPAPQPTAPGDAAPAPLPAVSIPIGYQRREWNAQARQYRQDIIEATRAALSAALQTALTPTAVQVLNAIIVNHNPAEPIMNTFLPVHAFNNSNLWSATYTHAERLLTKAGLDPKSILTTGTKSGDYQRLAIVHLDRFYGWHEINGPARHEAASAITDLLAIWPTDHDDILTPLGNELRHALRVATPWLEQTDNKTAVPN